MPSTDSISLLVIGRERESGNLGDDLLSDTPERQFLLVNIDGAIRWMSLIFVIFDSWLGDWPSNCIFELSRNNDGTDDDGKSFSLIPCQDTIRLEDVNYYIYDL